MCRVINHAKTTASCDSANRSYVAGVSETVRCENRACPPGDGFLNFVWVDVQGSRTNIGHHGPTVLPDYRRGGCDVAKWRRNDLASQIQRAACHLNRNCSVTNEEQVINAKVLL